MEKVTNEELLKIVGLNTFKVVLGTWSMFHSVSVPDVEAPQIAVLLFYEIGLPMDVPEKVGFCTYSVTHTAGYSSKKRCSRITMFPVGGYLFHSASSQKTLH
jgi:hypothetical protein